VKEAGKGEERHSPFRLGIGRAGLPRCENLTEVGQAKQYERKDYE